MRGYSDFPVFVKEISKEEIALFGLEVVNEARTSIVFKNKYLVFAIAIDDLSIVCKFKFPSMDWLPLNYGISIEELLRCKKLDRYYISSIEEFKASSNSIDEENNIYTKQILLIHSILRAHFTDVLSGNFNNCIQQLIKDKTEEFYLINSLNKYSDNDSISSIFNKYRISDLTWRLDFKAWLKNNSKDIDELNNLERL